MESYIINIGMVNTVFLMKSSCKTYFRKGTEQNNTISKGPSSIGGVCGYSIEWLTIPVFAQNINAGIPYFKGSANVNFQQFSGIPHC